jgi:hypothetical protein
MDTRELFERLVIDEPPLSINGSAMTERGHQAARRRLGGVGAAAVAVLAVATIGVTQLARPDQRHRGTLIPAEQPGVASLPFISSAQITASALAARALLLAVAREHGGPIESLPAGPAVSVDNKSSATSTVAYPVGANSTVLFMTAQSTAATLARFGRGVAGNPCDSVGKAVSGSGGCDSETLGGGSVLVSYSVQKAPPAQPPAADNGTTQPITRYALVLAHDGSSLELSTTAIAGYTGASATLVRLDPAEHPDAQELAALTEQSARAWVAAASGFPLDPTASPQSRDQSPPSRATSSVAAFPFVSSAQVKSADAEMTALLVAAADPLGPPVVRGHAAISPTKGAQPTSWEALVQLASPSPSVFVHLTVAAPDAARTLYGDALTKGPCAGAIPNGRSGASCRREELPGGGTVWTYDSVQPHLPNGGTVTSSTPTELMQRSELVVATDGSALQVMEFAELPGDGDDVALPATGVLDGSALAALAKAAASAWQAAG